MVWLNLTILLCILWSSNCCESNTQIGRNPVFLNSLFCMCIPILFLCISYPCIVRILKFKQALTQLLLLNMCQRKPCVVCPAPAVLCSTQLSCSNDGRVHHSRDPLSRLISPPQIFFPAAGSHDNCITIINWADDLEDYTGPQERPHSFVICLRYASLNMMTCYIIVVFTY